MTISKEEIERIAKLASVMPDEMEMTQLVRDIDAIVGFVGQLSAIDAAETLPNFRPGPTEAPLRDDVVAPIDLVRPIADFAPQLQDGFFLVPRLGGVGGE